MILGLLTIGICSWFSNQNLAFVVILAILALELILHRQLSDASFFVWLKYINTSILLNTDLLLAKYLNLPLGSIPIGLSVAAGVFMVLLGLASFFGFLAGMVWNGQRCRFAPGTRLCLDSDTASLEASQRISPADRTEKSIFMEARHSCRSPLCPW